MVTLGQTPGVNTINLVYRNETARKCRDSCFMLDAASNVLDDRIRSEPTRMGENTIGTAEVDRLVEYRDAGPERDREARREHWVSYLRGGTRPSLHGFKPM